MGTNAFGLAPVPRPSRTSHRRRSPRPLFDTRTHAHAPLLSAGRVDRVLPGRDGLDRGRATIVDDRTAEDSGRSFLDAQRSLARDPPGLLLPAIDHEGHLPRRKGPCGGGL